MSTVVFDPKRDILVGETTSLAELVFNRLFSNSPASIGDYLGGGEVATKDSDLGGWWGDVTFGSKIWLLLKSGKLLSNTPEQCKQYILSALSPLQSAGIIGKLEVVVTATGTPKNGLQAIIKLYKPTGEVEVIQYDDLWANVR